MTSSSASFPTPARRSTILRSVLIPTIASFVMTAMVGYYATHLVPVHHLPMFAKIGYPYLGASRERAPLPSRHTRPPRAGPPDPARPGGATLGPGPRKLAPCPSGVS